MFEEAATEWKQAVESHAKTGQTKQQIKAMIDLASAYQSVGHSHQAIDTLRSAIQLAEKAGDPHGALLAKNALGVACRFTLQSDEGEKALRESLELAQAAPDGDGKTQSTILNNLGNLLFDQDQCDEAMEAYGQSYTLAQKTNHRSMLAKSACNYAFAAARDRDWPRAKEWCGRAMDDVSKLRPSHDQAGLFSLIGHSYSDIASGEGIGDGQILALAQEAYRRALETAEGLRDRRAMSYALGYAGRLYESEGAYDEALDCTRRASFLAQQVGAPDALYRWQWQIGRIHWAQGGLEEAIPSYRRAIQTLQGIRNDLALARRNLRGETFRESAGGVFFELSDALLQKADRLTDPAAIQQVLTEARDTVEQLKSVELEDYLQDDCVHLLKKASVEAVTANAAVIYIIPLADRTEVLISQASGISRFKVAATALDLTQEARELRQKLETRTTHEYLDPAQRLYRWFIEPLKAHVDTNQIDTLVFVPDGPLRTIPFSSLHDGEHFLIEQFAVAVTPGLTLMDPKPIPRKNIEMLLGGLSEREEIVTADGTRYEFSPLPYVPAEMENLRRLYRGPARLNQQFTTQALEQDFTQAQYEMVHFASHGQFDQDARKTFILTHNGMLTLNQLEALIRPSQVRGKPVELLALSACQTAAGDDRAALGLAGVAVKAGARSAFATLWFVNDESTALVVSEFYAQLRRSKDVSKAKALQQAQLRLLKDRRYRHPCYWAPYLVIGNWL